MGLSPSEPSPGDRDADSTTVEPSAEPPSEAATPPDRRSSGFGVALLLAAAAVVAAIVTARASFLGSEATDHWQRSVREEERRGALLIQGVRFTYGEEGDVSFMIATSEARAAALEEAAASAPPDVAERLTAEAQVHSQVADAMRESVVFGTDPRFTLPSGGYGLAASLASDRAEEGADVMADPLATVRAGDEASRHAIRILAVAIVVGLAFMAGSLAQALPSRRRLLLIAGWVVLGVASALALAVELTA
jgi:hypothetical protein